MLTVAGEGLGFRLLTLLPGGALAAESPGAAIVASKAVPLGLVLRKVDEDVAAEQLLAAHGHRLLGGPSCGKVQVTKTPRPLVLIAGCRSTQITLWLSISCNDPSRIACGMCQRCKKEQCQTTGQSRLRHCTVLGQT